MIPGLRVVNPLFTNRENDQTSFSPTSVKYEEVSMTHLGSSQPPGEQYENVDLEDPPEYSRIEHSISVKNTSTPSTTDSHLPLETKYSTTEESNERMFDDPKYALVDSLPSRSDVPVHILESTSYGENNVETSHPSMNMGSSEYSRLENSVILKETSSSSSPDSGSSPQSNPPDMEVVSRVFDDPRYTFVEPRPHMPIQLAKSAPQEESGYYETVDVLDQNHPFEVKNNRKLSYDSSTDSPHTYTQVLPKQKRKKEDKTFQIVSTEDKYISEKGHVYHVLENSTKSEMGGGQATDCVSAS